MDKTRMPLNLQFFAQDGGEVKGEQVAGQSGNNNPQNQQPLQFDYEKLASIIAGKQDVTEDKVLGGYFKSQGLSGDEMQHAIKDFKEQKAKNTPNASELKAQLEQSNKALTEAKINNQATMEAISLGIEAKTIPYVLKLADMSKAVNADGTINTEEVKKAMQKVLEDVPALKGAGAPDSSQQGGFRIGGGTDNNNPNSPEAQENMLRGIFGIRERK